MGKLEEEKNPRGRRMMFGCLGVLVGVIVAVWIWIGPLFLTAKKKGFLDPEIKRTYEGDSLTNLKDIHTALMLYQESEGQLPFADSWMDATWPRLQTGDMDEEHAKRKMKSPSLWEENPQAYGYAYNEAASGVYSDDIPEPDLTPLVFDSRDLTWNAFGNPAQLAPDPKRPEGNFAVTVSGNVVKLDSILK